MLDILRSQPEEIACQSCLAQLPDYVAAQLAGDDYLARYREVALHLDSCVECASAYERLYELELAVVENRLPETQVSIQPDLDFLDSTVSASPPETLAEALRKAFRRTGDAIALTFSADLLSFLQPQPALSTLRAPADSERYGERIFSLDEEAVAAEELPFTVTAYRDREDEHLCLLELVASPPGRAWPELEGIEFIVTAGEHSWRGVTDAWGMVSFEGVPVECLPPMIIEMRF